MEIHSKFTCPLPENLSLVDFILQYFDQYGDREAVIDAASGRSYTYSQIRSLSRKVASALIRRGVKKGDAVAIYLPNVPEYPIIFIGIIMAGGVATTCNPLYTAKELSHQVTLTEAQHLFTVNLFVDKAKDTAAMSNISNLYVIGSPTGDGITSFQDLLADNGDNLTEVQFNCREDVAVMPFSSGTTGLPKGVMLTHYNIVSNVTQGTFKDFFDINSDDVLLALLPWFHIFGMVTILIAGLRFGSKVVSMARFEPLVFLETIQKYKITVAPIVPPICVFLSKHPSVSNFDVSSVRDVFCAAAPLGSETQSAIISRFGLSVRQGYGMTELSPLIAMSLRGHKSSGSVGYLAPNTKCKVIDIETGKMLPTGKSGELCFMGPQVMKGYLKNKEATDRTIDADGWLHSGDIGYYDESEQFYVVDRLKELIKYKGFQVPPAELEELLLTHAKIADAAVVGVPNEEAGELPKAFIVKRVDDVTEEEIVAFVASEVAPYKKLRGGVEFIKAIPKSASGKILRRQLRDK